MHLISISIYVHSGKFLGKIHKFSSLPLEYLIPLQLVPISVHKYIFSGMVNACSTCHVVFCRVESFTQITSISLTFRLFGFVLLGGWVVFCCWFGLVLCFIEK